MIRSPALRKKIGEYTQNRLPIRLLRVSDMTLVDRSNLQDEVFRKIYPESTTCKEEGEKCRCFEKAKYWLKYSILSYRWGSNEITFNEFKELRSKLDEIAFNEFKKLRSKLDEGGNIGGSGKQS
jgi:hypothetical protein